MTPRKYSYQNRLLATGLCSAYNNNLSLSQNFELGSDILSKAHSNLDMQGINIVFYIWKDWKHFFLMKSVFLFIYYVLFGCPTANFGPLPRAQPHSPNLNHSVYVSFLPKGHWKPHNKIGSLNPAEHLVEFEPGTFRFAHNALTLLACTFTMHDISIYPCYLNVIYWSTWSKSRDLVQLLSSRGLPGSKKQTLFECALSVILDGSET